MRGANTTWESSPDGSQDQLNEVGGRRARGKRGQVAKGRQRVSATRKERQPRWLARPNNEVRGRGQGQRRPMVTRSLRGVPILGKAAQVAHRTK